MTEGDDKRVDELFAQLTLDERIALTAGIDMWHTPNIERLGLSSMRMTDGPVGARGTQHAGGPQSACFPCGTALAATWDVELIENVGRHLAAETHAKGAHMLLGPTINIHRYPLAGRNFECYSEDPMLTAKIAIAYVNGLQGEGVGACIKHFVANDSEFERHTISSEVDERTLREIYLRPFEIALRDAKPWGVMAAYNKLHGTWCTEHPRLLTEILRDEWEYDGVVVSDWWATHTTAEASTAGLDIEMPGPPLYRGTALAAAVKSGEVSEGAINASARRVLLAIIRTGSLDLADREERTADTPERRAVARLAASSAIVLLRNDVLDDARLLPLDPSAFKSIAVIGPNADVANIFGGGSASVTPYYAITILDGLRARFPAIELRHEVGCEITPYPAPLDSRWLSTREGAPGLTATYVAGSDPDGPGLFTRPVPGFALMWSEATMDGLDVDEWSLRIEGRVQVPEDGEYVFQITSTGRFRMRIAGANVVDGWDTEHQDQQRRVDGAVDLVAGTAYELRVDLVPARPGAAHAIGLRCKTTLAADAFERAVAVARNSDVAILVVGTNGDWETEGKDRAHFDMPGRQVELVEAVIAANPHTIVIVNAGSPVSLACARTAPALLQSWFLGQETGNAVADVLSGDLDASGRLPTTLPRNIEDTPAFPHYPGADGQVQYGEGVFVGYRHYEARGVEPEFPFGHGCSYTTFDYANLDVALVGDEVIVNVAVTNTGARPGTEVVQVYIADLDASVPRPVKELAAFAKVKLEPGATETLQMRFNREALAFWSETARGWVVEPGTFEILIGSSSADIRLRTTIRVDG